jgi:MFS transporter, DHA1 family, inner membrane transport protein
MESILEKDSKNGIVLSKKQGLITIALLASIQFVFAVDYILMFPLGPKMIAALNIGTIEYGVLISAYTISAAIMGLLSSFYIDSYPRKKVLLVALSFFILGNLCFVLSQTYPLILLSRILTGAFGGVLSPLVIIYVGDLFPVEKLGKNTSAVMISNAMATILGIPLALFIAERFNWQTPFVGMMVFNALILAACYFYIPVVNMSIKKYQRLKIWYFVNNPKFIWPIIFMSMLTFAGGATILPFIATYVVKNFGFTSTDLALIFFCGGISAFLVNSFIGFFIDRYGRQNVFLLLNFISIIPIAFITLSPFENKIIILSITALFFGVSTARAISGITYLNSLMPQEQRGRYITINSSIQLMASSIATLLSGSILYTENNLVVNFDLLGIIAICATITCIFAAFVLEE